mgnify:CR=1 FL=1|tara:strand:+ start:261 stop:431 length:171 start_codon:yes stop_codon:yes gene_type:complete
MVNTQKHKSPLSFMSKHSQSSPLNATGVYDAETENAPIDDRMGNVASSPSSKKPKK